MVKCSFCGHENEEPARFCALCKTDLSVPAPLVPAAAGGSFEAVPPAGTDELIAETVHIDRIPKVESLSAQATGIEVGGRPLTAEVVMPLAGAAPAGSQNGAKSATSAAQPEAARETKPRLVVLRGEKIDMQYPIYAGKNYIGRTDEKPVDIDLECQEPADRIWASRQHAVITYDNGVLTIEDLNSLNGTFVNRTRVHPGQVRTLQANDIIQCGTVQMRVIVG